MKPLRESVTEALSPAPISGGARSGTRARFALAVIAGAGVGAVLEWSVPHLPFSLEPLGNSAAPWLIVAFGVALSTRRACESLALAVVTLITLVAGFYLAQDSRGWAVSEHQVVLWTAASCVAGPLVGIAAVSLRRNGRMAAAVGAGAVGGLLVGEAVYGLRVLRFSSPVRYWHVQLAVGLGLAVALPVWRSRRRLISSIPALAASLAACAVVGLGTLVAYKLP